jgi:hypothetical protein
MLDLNDFREITRACGYFEQPFWKFKHWKFGILMSIFYWEQYGFRVVVIFKRKKTLI